MAALRLFHVETENDTLVVTVRGNVGGFADSDIISEFDALLKTVQESGVRRIVIDLDNQPYFGSIILESLRRLWNLLQPENGRMALCGVSEFGVEVLQVARFDTLWPICNSRSEAMQAVNS